MSKMSDSAAQSAADGRVAPAVAAFPSLSAALVEAQRMARGVGKASNNTFDGYKYASGDAMLAEGRRVLSACGLAPVLLGYTLDEGDETHEAKITLRFRLLWAGGEPMDFEPRTLTIHTVGKKPLDKAITTGQTTAWGYFIRDVLCLDRVGVNADDVDARDDSKHEPRRPPPAREPTTMRNKIVVSCVHCNADIAIGEGLSRKKDGEWRSIHDTLAMPCLARFKAEQDAAAAADDDARRQTGGE